MYTSATIGFFDGVHRGHQYLIRQLDEAASARGEQPLIVTFDRHPRQVVGSDWQPQLLSSLDEKLLLLRQTGVSRIKVLHFTPQMAALTAREFMEQVLRDELSVRTLLIGYDNHFGHNRTEGFADYVRYGQELGIEVIEAKPLVEQGVAISSSLVRRLLGQGDVAAAARCLSRCYELTGKVVGGEHIGRQLGFPTANLQPTEPLRLVPATGVYAVRVKLDDDPTELQGMMNIGTRPTFDGHKQTLEVNLFGFSGNLYDRTLTVAFVARLRGEQYFPSPEALARQLQDDAYQAQSLLAP